MQRSLLFKLFKLFKAGSCVICALVFSSLVLGPLTAPTQAGRILDSMAIEGSPQEPAWPSVERTFTWGSQQVCLQIHTPLAPKCFVYGSASWPQGWFDCFPSLHQIFLYYTKDLYDDILDKTVYLHSENRSVYIILDPEAPKNTTFLDFHYDSQTRRQILSNLTDTISNLTALGMDGFVLGDEWPRGCSPEPITINTVARYNQTYFAETGRWMRPEGGDRAEKAMLAEWFYDRSLEAWNQISLELRQTFPKILMGTNIDLFLKPDYTQQDVAFWKSGHFLDKLDMNPYDFILSHYFTGMPKDSAPETIDQTSLKTLDSSVERMLAATKRNAKPLYVMLAAHYNQPQTVTPGHMVAEWNLLAEKNISAIGWFAFDIWLKGWGSSKWGETSFLGDQPHQEYPYGPVYIPFRIERFLALRALSNIRDEAVLEDETNRLTAGCEPSGCTAQPYIMLEEEECLSAKLSPSGKTLMLVAQTRIQIRNASKPYTVLGEIPSLGGLFVSADWSPGGDQVAYTTTDGRLGIADLGNMSSVIGGLNGKPGTSMVWRCGEEAVLPAVHAFGQVCWSPAGGLIACEAGGGILILQCSKLADPGYGGWSLEPAASNCSLAGWSHDGRYLAVADPEGLRAWQVLGPTNVSIINKLQTKQVRPGSLSWAHHSYSVAFALSGREEDQLVIWDVQSNTTQTGLLGVSCVTSSAWNCSDGLIVLGTKPEAIILTAFSTNTVYVDLNKEPLAPSAMEMDLSVSGSEDREDYWAKFMDTWLPPQICKVVSPDPRPSHNDSNDTVLSLSFSHSQTSQILIICEPHRVLAATLRQSQTGLAHVSGRVEVEVLPTSSELCGDPCDIDWSGERLLAATINHPINQIKIWQIGQDGSSHLVQALWDPDGPKALAFSHQGAQLAYSTRTGGIRIWDLTQEGKVTNVADVAECFGPERSVDLLSYSPDGAYLALVSPQSGKGAYILDTDNASHIREVGRPALWAAWLPETSCLAISSPDGISLWDVDAGGPCLLLSSISTESPAFWIGFSPHGSLLAAASEIDGNGLTELRFYRTLGKEMVPVDLKRLVPQRDENCLGGPFSWHPELDMLVSGFGVTRYKDPLREEWHKETLGMCLRAVWVWSDRLRPGIAVWKPTVGTATLELASCFPALTDVLRCAEWSPDGYFLATASDDGWLILWQTQIVIGETQEFRSGLIVLAVSILAQACLRHMRHMPRSPQAPAPTAKLQCPDKCI